MNKVQQFLNKYWFLFPLFIVTINNSVVYKDINTFYQLIIMPASDTFGSVTSVNRVDASNGTFYDCKIKYVVTDRTYVLNGSISYDERGNIKVNDSLLVLYNVKNPRLSTIYSRLDVSVFAAFWFLMLALSSYCLATVLKKIYFSLIKYFGNKAEKESS